MWTRIFYFLALFSYLNLLFYQAGVNTNTRATNISTQYFMGDSLLEFVLDDVLDIPIEVPEKDAEYIIPKTKIKMDKICGSKLKIR